MYEEKYLKNIINISREMDWNRLQPVLAVYHNEIFNLIKPLRKIKNDNKKIFFLILIEFIEHLF